MTDDRKIPPLTRLEYLGYSLLFLYTGIKAVMFLVEDRGTVEAWVLAILGGFVTLLICVTGIMLAVVGKEPDL